MIWNRDGVIWYSEDEVESYKQSEQEGLEIVAELEYENARLKSCLQEIKAIAEELLEGGLEPQSVEHQLRLKGKRELANIILDLITKAESEG